MPKNKRANSSGQIAKSTEIKRDELRKKELNKQIEDLYKLQQNTPVEKVKEWYMGEYTKQWQFNKLKNIKTAEIDPYTGSGLRIYNISMMKYKFNYNTK